MKKRRYPIARAAELQIAYAEACKPRFHELLGHAIEADRLPSEDARLIVAAAQDVARESGSPPGSLAVVVQQLRLRVNQGKMTIESMTSCEDALLAVEDLGGVPDLEGLIHTVAPAVRDAQFQDGVEATIQELGKGGDAEAAADRFAKIGLIGKARVATGTTAKWDISDITAAGLSTIRDPLPTGVTDLDVALGGGLERGTLGMFLGGSGDGKSLVLCHLSAEAIMEGRRVAYISLELGENQIKQRVYANILNMTAKDLAENAAEAVRRRQLLDAHFMKVGRPPIGAFRVIYMTPKVSSVSTIKGWLKDMTQQGEDFDVIVVDYGDKLGASSTLEAKGTYHAQGSVTDQLRNLIIERDGWCWTASQTTGRQGRKKKIDLEDTADSMEKVRIADTVVAIQRGEDDITQNTVRFRLPKRRNGQAHVEVGPILMDQEHGRMVVIDRGEPW